MRVTSPGGYSLSPGGFRVCIVTDVSEVTPVMLEAIAQADLLILESNHDLARLLSDPYPYHLKQRILSSTGLLSYAQAAEDVLRTWRCDSDTGSGWPTSVVLIINPKVPLQYAAKLARRWG